MKFQMHTLVDITQTGARRGDDLYKCKQQQNYMSFLQTISLRSNPTITSQDLQKTKIEKYGFGEKHKGSHRLWSVEFFFEAEDSHSIELLTSDLQYIPIITGINETAKFPTKAFITNDDVYRNTVFNTIR
jgi:hypothetical protein